MKKFFFTLSLSLVCLMGFACERELTGTAKKPPETICNDGIDNDGDGKVDCDDADCATSAHCNEQGPEILCDDGIDNDADGAVDCDDTDCASATECAVPAENCTNEIDDDRDGKIDCADADCAEATNCLPSVEVCTDGVDNDQDGFVDCEDVDCASHQTCQPVCGNGVIEEGEGCETGSNFGGKTCQTYGFDGGTLTCVGCIIGTANCTECGDGICESGENCPEDCEDGPVCGNGIRELGEVCDGADLNGQTCVSRGFDGGNLACNASCSAFVTTGCSNEPEPTAEDCDNGIDDDHDGFIDCEDGDCWSQAACQVAYCGDGVCNGSETQSNCPADCGGSLTENCYDGLDNDGDNLVDWLDPNCAGAIPSGKNPELYCANGYDDNSNGYYDTRDHSCSSYGRVGTGTSFFTCIPKQGTVDYGCVCSDAPTTWVTTTSGQKTTTTGKACVGNSHPTGTTSWEVGWIGSSCTVDNILAHMDLDGYRDFSAIQFMYVSRTAGTASNMAIVVGCSYLPGTTDQSQGNMGVMEDPNDSAQRAFMDNIFPNGKWRVIYVGSSAISRLSWYEGYFYPR